MSNITINDLLDKAGTRYRLVIMVSQRARDLTANAKPLIEHVNGDKPIGVALKELNEGKITYTELKKQPEKKSK